MLQCVILNFEQIGQEEFKTIPYIKIFDKTTTIEEILKWIKSIDKNKTIADVYFTDK